MDYKEPEYVNDLIIKLKSEYKDLVAERKELENKLKRREEKYNHYKSQNAAESVGYRTGITSKNDTEIEKLDMDVENMNLEMALLIPELRSSLQNLEKDTRQWEVLTSNSKQRIFEQFLGKSTLKDSRYSKSKSYSIFDNVKIDETYDEYISKISNLRAKRGIMINEARAENQKLTSLIAQSRNETMDNIDKNVSLEKAINELKEIIHFEKSKEKILKDEHIKLRNELEENFGKDNGWQYEIFKSGAVNGLFPLSQFITTFRPWIYSDDSSWENQKTFQGLIMNAVEIELQNGWNPDSFKKDPKNFVSNFLSTNNSIPFNIFYTLIKLIIDKYE